MNVFRGDTPQAREVLVTYLARKIGVSIDDMIGRTPYEVIGVVSDDDKLMGACLFTNLRLHAIELAWAGEPGWMTPKVLHAVWSYPFEQLKVLAVTSYIRPDNTTAQDFVERMGAYKCGEVPHAFGHGTPGYLYVMDRDTCRWIKPKGDEDVRKRAEAA